MSHDWAKTLCTSFKGRFFNTKDAASKQLIVPDVPASTPQGDVPRLDSLARGEDSAGRLCGRRPALRQRRQRPGRKAVPWWQTWGFHCFYMFLLVFNVYVLIFLCFFCGSNDVFGEGEIVHVGFHVNQVLIVFWNILYLLS